MLETAKDSSRRTSKKRTKAASMLGDGHWDIAAPRRGQRSSLLGIFTLLPWLSAGNESEMVRSFNPNVLIFGSSK